MKNNAERADLLLSRFQKSAVNETERRFWIGRTYERLEFEGLVPQGSLKIERACLKSPHLRVVAAYWAFEVFEWDSPSKEMLATWFKDFGDKAFDKESEQKQNTIDRKSTNPSEEPTP